jgi:hypothetical protein
MFYDVAIHAEFLDAVRRSRIVRGLFGLRCWGASGGGAAIAGGRSARARHAASSKSLPLQLPAC